jgi:restriction system protein
MRTNLESAEVDTSEWNLQLLQSMDWKLFEDLCAEVLKAAGHQAEVTGAGPDQCVDIRMKIGDGRGDPEIAVQCKRQEQPVRVGQVREFLGAILPQGYSRGVFITSGTFLDRAREEFAEASDVRLVDGLEFLEGVADLGQESSRKLLDYVVRDQGEDWKIPTCPSCHIKLVYRQPKPGAKKQYKPFWGCRNFARPDEEKCRVRMYS